MYFKTCLLFNNYVSNPGIDNSFSQKTANLYVICKFAKEIFIYEFFANPQIKTSPKICIQKISVK